MNSNKHLTWPLFHIHRTTEHGSSPWRVSKSSRTHSIPPKPVRLPRRISGHSQRKTHLLPRNALKIQQKGRSRDHFPRWIAESSGKYCLITRIKCGISRGRGGDNTWSNYTILVWLYKMIYWKRIEIFINCPQMMRLSWRSTNVMTMICVALWARVECVASYDPLDLGTPYILPIHAEPRIDYIAGAGLKVYQPRYTKDSETLEPWKVPR